MSGKVIQMEFNLFEVAEINNFNSREFINFILLTNKEVVILKTASNGLPLFKINGSNVKPLIEKFKKSKKNFFQILFNI
jgi:hypothetical protein